MSRVQVLSAVQFCFAFFRKSRFRGFRSLRSEKIAKWIGIFPKKSRDEKTGEISRNLPFSLVFSCGSILTTQHGRGRRIRTRDPRFWRPVLYQLSYTPIVDFVNTSYYITLFVGLQAFFEKKFLSSKKSLFGRFFSVRLVCGFRFLGCFTRLLPAGFHRPAPPCSSATEERGAGGRSH